jgi:hypothetical protein
VIAWGFVFLHPFEDGNGRIHRFLVLDLFIKLCLQNNGKLAKGRPISPFSAKKNSKPWKPPSEKATACNPHRPGLPWRLPELIGHPKRV